jgi:hypothetical protein
MNDQDHSLSLSDPDRSLVLSHLLLNFLKNLVSCQTSLRSLEPRRRFHVSIPEPHRAGLRSASANGHNLTVAATEIY